MGDKQLTMMIPKHNFWGKIKKDLVRFKFDKKGFATINIFIFIFMVFMWILLVGIYLTIFNLINDNLDIDVDMGQVNLGETVQDTFGQFNNSFTTHADIIGVMIIFGMIINMFASAYFFRGKYPKIFIIVDIILLVFAYILAVYVSNTYETLINSTALLDIYINDLSKASGFILKLPTYVGVIGMIIMILSYAGFPRDTEREASIGEY